MGDSASGSASSRARRNRLTPFAPGLQFTQLARVESSTSPPRSAMSIATTDSNRSARLPRSRAVRKPFVTRKPPSITTSSSGSEARRNLTPTLARALTSRATVASMGSQGGMSRPRIQAAVVPENAYSDGKRSSTARSFSSVSYGRPLHAYWPRAMRRHCRVWRLSHFSPTSRALATAKGPPRSSIGTYVTCSPCNSGGNMHPGQSRSLRAPTVAVCPACQPFDRGKNPVSPDYPTRWRLVSASSGRRWCRRAAVRRRTPAPGSGGPGCP